MKIFVDSWLGQLYQNILRINYEHISNIQRFNLIDSQLLFRNFSAILRRDVRSTFPCVVWRRVDAANAFHGNPASSHRGLRFYPISVFFCVRGCTRPRAKKARARGERGRRWKRCIKLANDISSWESRESLMETEAREGTIPGPGGEKFVYARTRSPCWRDVND